MNSQKTEEEKKEIRERLDKDTNRKSGKMKQNLSNSIRA